MHRPTRALVVALVLAGLVLASPAAGHAAPRHRSCPITFTRAMFSRPARLFYRGTRIPSTGEVASLWRFLNCARHPWDKPADHRVWRRERAANAARRAAALPPPLSSLANCIIERESTWNPQAVNGDHEGYAQWDPDAWANDGGTRYASTPLGATPAQQETVLMDALNAGKSYQWTPFDGC